MDNIHEVKKCDACGMETNNFYHIRLKSGKYRICKWCAHSAVEALEIAQGVEMERSINVE